MSHVILTVTYKGTETRAVFAESTVVTTTDGKKLATDIKVGHRVCIRRDLPCVEVTAVEAPHGG